MFFVICLFFVFESVRFRSEVNILYLFGNHSIGENCCQRRFYIKDVKTFRQIVYKESKSNYSCISIFFTTGFAFFYILFFCFWCVRLLHQSNLLTSASSLFDIRELSLTVFRQKLSSFAPSN